MNVQFFVTKFFYFLTSVTPIVLLLNVIVSTRNSILMNNEILSLKNEIALLKCELQIVTSKLDLKPEIAASMPTSVSDIPVEVIFVAKLLVGVTLVGVTLVLIYSICSGSGLPDSGNCGVVPVDKNFLSGTPGSPVSSFEQASTKLIDSTSNNLISEALSFLEQSTVVEKKVIGSIFFESIDPTLYSAPNVHDIDLPDTVNYSEQFLNQLAALTARIL
jgi:hypothetical protein